MMTIKALTKRNVQFHLGSDVGVLMYRLAERADLFGKNVCWGRGVNVLGTYFYISAHIEFICCYQFTHDSAFVFGKGGSSPLSKLLQLGWAGWAGPCQLNMFHSEFLDPFRSFSVGYKSQSNDANDSKKEDLSRLFCFIIEHIEATRINQLLYTAYIKDPISFDLFKLCMNCSFSPFLC